MLYKHRRPNVTFKEIFNKCIIDYKRDKISHLLKHARESQHTHAWKDDLKILSDNYKSSTQRKISEALYIRILKLM